MARLSAGAGAGRPGRHRDPAHRGEQPGRLDVEGQVGDARPAGCVAAIDDERRAETIVQAHRQPGDMIGIGRHPLSRDRCCRAQPDAQRRRQRPRPAILLPAAVEQRNQVDPCSPVQRADPLGAIDLVPADAHQVDAQPGHVDLAEPLRRVAVHQCAGGVRQGGDFGDRLDHARLVVDQHGRDQGDIGADRRRQRRPVDQPVAPDPDHRQAAADRFEPPRRFQDTAMFGRQRDHPPPRRPRRQHHTLQRPVDRLGRAGGEGHGVGRDPDDGRDLRARDRDCGVRLIPPAMRRVRVAEALRGPRRHRRDHCGIDRRRRRIIEIGRHHERSYPRSQSTDLVKFTRSSRPRR